ncbi:MAG: response regulator transcription factor [Paenibacillaceae bacterium]|nr:response regulator transcription factor [Paenibacillaceae bacterium]
MTKLLIVDDDRFIREGLVQLIDWDDLGVEIVGMAEGGREALRMFEDRQPHIVLTDIRMPQGDGLELIERIRDKGWQTQIIVLSGYNDYAYVRQAMKFQVEDYLLKPVDATELTNIIKNCCESNDEQWRNEQLKRESFQLLRDNILLRWIENRIQPDQLGEKLSFLGIDVKKKDLFQAGVISWTDWKEAELSRSEQQFRSFAIVNCVGEALANEDRGIAFPNQSKEIVCLLFGKSRQGFDSASFAADNLQWMRKIANLYAPALKTPWFCTLGSVSANTQSVHVAYRDALRLQDHIHLMEGPICVDKSTVAKHDHAALYVSDNREHVLAALLAGKRDLCTEAVGKDFQWVVNQHDPLSAARHAAAEWIVLIKLALKQKKLPLDKFFAGNQTMMHLFRRNDIGDIRNDLLQLLNELDMAWRSNEPKKRKSIALQVEKFLHSHYAEELSLQIIADRFNVNNIYLGRLFKEETGDYFSDYLTNIRLDKAKELLETTPLNASEISVRVGYADPNYFFRKFKQTIGLSPTEYRNLHEKT